MAFGIKSVIPSVPKTPSFGVSPLGYFTGGIGPSAINNFGVKNPFDQTPPGINYAPPNLPPCDPNSYFKEYAQAPKLSDTANISNIYAPLETAAQRRYQLAQDKISQQSNADLGTNLDQLQRKFSSQGLGTASGAAIKINQKAINQAEGQKNQALEGLNTQQQEEAAQLGFQKANAMAQQASQQADLDFKNRVYNFDKGSKLAELDLSSRQLELQKYETGVNAQTAQQMQRQQQGGLLTKFLGPLL